MGVPFVDFQLQLSNIKGGDAIMAIANKHGLWVIEDCAQAHLAQFKGQSIGTFGNAATYSFYPGKNLGAMGDAGALVTNDAALPEQVAMLARHGRLVKHQHQIEGSTADCKACRPRSCQRSCPI